MSVRGRWCREGDTVYLCGTLGAEFDRWQRSLAAVSAADAYFAQQIGLEAVERVMDDLEKEAEESLKPGEWLERRKSPGYGKMPLSSSREILEKLDATRRLGVALTESDLLVPTKSVTAICEVKR